MNNIQTNVGRVVESFHTITIKIYHCGGIRTKEIALFYFIQPVFTGSYDTEIFRWFLEELKTPEFPFEISDL